MFNRNLLFSDHVGLPLKIRLDLTVENVSIKERTYYSRVAWNKASSESIDRYRDDVELKLYRIVYDKDPLQCNDTSCTCTGHVDKLGGFLPSNFKYVHRSIAIYVYHGTRIRIETTKRGKSHSWVVTRGGQFEATGTILA